MNFSFRFSHGFTDSPPENHSAAIPARNSGGKPFLEIVLFGALVTAFLGARPYDHQLFLALNALHSPLTDRLWWFITHTGDGLVLGVLVGAAVVIRPRVALAGVVLLLVCSLFVHVLKALLPSPRPWTCLDDVHVVGQVLRSGSFPSGHAGAGLALALAVVRYGGSGLVGWLAVLLGGAIGVSRVFVGAHFPGDVLAGMAVASASAVLVHVTLGPCIKRWIPERPDFSNPFVRVMLVLEIGAAAGASLLYGPFFAPAPAVAMLLGLAALIFVLACWMRERSSEPFA